MSEDVKKNRVLVINCNESEITIKPSTEYKLEVNNQNIITDITSIPGKEDITKNEDGSYTLPNPSSMIGDEIIFKRRGK